MIKKKRYPNLLRLYRKAHGWDQQQVANFIGIRSRDTISRWENSHVFPTAINIFKLAALYGVMADKLFSPLTTALWQEKIKRQKKLYKQEIKKAS